MAQPKVELAREMSLFDITMIGVGAMIGAGIFVLTGIAAGEAGPALILSFALNGVITVFTAMVYAELGSAIPEAGGGYLWVKEGLPGPNAFLSGWMSWFAHAVAGSLYALGFGGYMGLLFSEVGVSLGIGPELMSKGFAVLIILLFLAINFRGASETGTVGNIVTMLKIVVLLIFIASGLLTILDHPVYLDKFDDFAPNGFVGVLGAMGLTFIAFEGYEIIVQAGEEVVEPRRNIPKAIFLSLAIVVPIYIAVAFVSLGAPNPEGGEATFQWLAAHAEIGIAEAARQFMPLGTLLILIGGLLSTMSALNATTYSSTRVSFAMGRDRGLPDAFAEVHPKTRTPHKALLFTGVLITFMALAIPIEDVAAAADIMFLLLFLQVNIAIMTIREKYGQKLAYGYLTPFFPIVPIIGIVTKFFLAIFLFNVSPIAWVFAVIWMVVGLGIFYVYSRPRQTEETRTLIFSQTALSPQVRAAYRVIVPIAHPASLATLLPPAIAAARRNRGMITLLNVIRIPDQTPISAGRAYVGKNQSLIDKALAMVPDDVPAEVVIRIAHRPAQAIIDTAREKRANLVIMGWRGKSKDPHKVIGRNIDQIYSDINCDVLTLQPSRYEEAKKILVPIYDVRQLALALNMAATLTPVHENSTQISVLHVLSPDAPQNGRPGNTIEQKLRDAIDAAVERHPHLDGHVALELVRSNEPVEAIVTTSAVYDYVILGATRDSWLKRRFFGSKPTRIAGLTETPLALVRPRTGRVRFGLHRMLNYIKGGYSEVTPESEKRLQDHGILTEETEPTAHDLHTSVNTTALLIIGAFTLLVVVMMYLGGGNTLTWIGTVAFLILLWAFTWVSMRAPEPEDVAHMVESQEQAAD